MDIKTGKWTRRQLNPGTEFSIEGGRVTVTQADDPRRFGAPARPWWTISVDGERYGAHLKTAKAAMDWAEQPGVARDIAKILLANEAAGKANPLPDRPEVVDAEDAEILRDKVVTEALAWAARGCVQDPDELAGLECAIENLRAAGVR